MVIYRYGRWRYTIGPRWLRMPFSLVYKILYKLVQIVTGISLPCEVKVGRNFIIDHFGGIVVNGYSEFGDDCRIRTGVVIGIKRVGETRAPRIGNNVDIGAGAKILGDITIGDNVLIGANAVVTKDVPCNSIVTNEPSVIRPRNREPVLIKAVD